MFTSLLAIPKTCSVKCSAKVLNMSRTHILRLCAEGRVESLVEGGKSVIPTDEIARILIERHRVRKHIQSDRRYCNEAVGR